MATIRWQSQSRDSRNSRGNFSIPLAVTVRPKHGDVIITHN